MNLLVFVPILFNANHIVAGPLPKFDGMTGLTGTAPAPGPTPGLQPQSSGSGPIRVPPLPPDKVSEYANLFEKSGAQNGVLSGVFMCI